MDLGWVDLAEMMTDVWSVVNEFSLPLIGIVLLAMSRRIIRIVKAF